MEKTVRRKESIFNRVLLTLKIIDEKIDKWVNHLIEVIEKEYQL